MRNIISLTGAALLALFLGFAAPAAASAPPPYQIVCTTGMITDVAKNVAGDRANVTGLMGPGVDPHLYKPTRQDIVTLTRADVVFYNGLLLEGKMTDALIRVAVAGKKVYAVTELLDESFLLEPQEFQGLYDPHVWMDPSAWKQAVEVIRDKLIEFDPEGASTYRANAQNYSEQLDELHAYCAQALATVPESQRILVTAHDAFAYFGRAYGIDVYGIQGISTESEAGLRRIQEIVDLLVERQVPAVFVETTVSDRNVRALIEGARARGHTVKIGGQLYSDAMGAPDTYEGTYIGMIDHNATTIARALGGNTPAGGMAGKLARAD